MRRLEVAIVAPTLEILGGHSVQATQLLRAWSHDPAVNAWLVPINPTPPAALRSARSVKYLRTVVNEATYVPLLLKMLPKADVVHVFSASYASFLLAPLPAMAIARAVGRPVVLNYHSGEAADHLARSSFARRAIAHADHVTVPSPYLASVFSRFGIDATVTPNLVDLNRYPFRERQPLTPRVLSTRNLAAPYNVACTIRAFRHVQDRWPAATLTLVGSGPHEPALRQLVAGLGLKGVRFAGRVEPDDMPRIYAGHDIYLQSPDVDNMPLSVLEAFSSGLPVVSTDVGGVPAILTHERHGLLAPVNDDRALADRVLHLLDAPDHARAMAWAAHASLHGYTWPVVRDAWLRVYHGVLREELPEAVKASS